MQEMMHDDHRPIAMTLDQIKQSAAAIAAEMQKAGDQLPPDLRQRFIDVRAALFQRGVYDPVLVRFDSATAPRATTAEVAGQLAAAAAAL